MYTAPSRAGLGRTRRHCKRMARKRMAPKGGKRQPAGITGPAAPAQTRHFQAQQTTACIGRSRRGRPARPRKRTEPGLRPRRRAAEQHIFNASSEIDYDSGRHAAKGRALLVLLQPLLVAKFSKRARGLPAAQGGGASNGPGADAARHSSRVAVLWRQPGGPDQSGWRQLSTPAKKHPRPSRQLTGRGWRRRADQGKEWRVVREGARWPC